VLGYFLGNVQFIAKNLDILAVVIVAISFIPIVRELRRGSSESSDA
jgi:hypothetical protein